MDYQLIIEEALDDAASAAIQEVVKVDQGKKDTCGEAFIRIEGRSGLARHLKTSGRVRRWDCPDHEINPTQVIHMYKGRPYGFDLHICKGLKKYQELCVTEAAAIAFVRVLRSYSIEAYVKRAID